ncbi:hypothetical protein G6L09_08045 [Agrobacterium rhizogenes]|nr:hypothetical protein [Rhizobium rhizogenes]NTH70507.1 hypothetical protein [Rhizobium rhizogenes]
MGLISPLLKWRDDRHRLAKLRFDLEDVEDKFRRKLEVESLKRGSEKWEKAYADYANDKDQIYAEIDQLETKNLLKRAKVWNVAIPPRPIPLPEPDRDDNYWDWCDVHGCYYLSDEGKELLRHKAYSEMEMFYKPWLSWMAVGISVLSLIISVFRS